MHELAPAARGGQEAGTRNTSLRHYGENVIMTVQTRDITLAKLDEVIKRAVIIVLSWSKRLECFAKQDPGRARQIS